VNRGGRRRWRCGFRHSQQTTMLIGRSNSDGSGVCVILVPLQFAEVVLYGFRWDECGTRELLSDQLAAILFRNARSRCCTGKQFLPEWQHNDLGQRNLFRRRKAFPSDVDLILANV